MSTSHLFPGRRPVRAVSAAGALLLALAAGPIGTSAAPPSGGTASVSITVDANCLATITYTWQGFKGRSLVAEVGLLDITGSSLNIGLAYAYATGKLGSTDSTTAQFQLTAGGTDPAARFGAVGRLGKFDRIGQFKETLPAAEATRIGPFNPNGCGDPITSPA